MRFAGRPLALLLLLSVLPIIGFAQSRPAGAQPQPLPKDPAQLMQLAWQQNGLHGDDLQPWHLRATWQMLDAKGKPEKQGTFEEWWAGPRQWKIVTDSPDVQKTDWETVQGFFSLVNHGSSGWIEDLVEEMILQPALAESAPEKLQFKAYDVRDHGAKLHCVRIKDAVDEFCFDPGLADLRTKTTSNLQIAMNSMGQFQGRYVARDTYIYRADMPSIQIHIDELDSLAVAEESQLTPPRQAKLVPAMSIRPAAVLAGHRISGDVPEYPPAARLTHVQGTVVLWAAIGTDGTIQHLEVISGPQLLQESALTAVKTWRFQPWLLNGKPVELHTQIDVVYNLGGGFVEVLRR